MTSPSGCQSGSCGVPRREATSGKWRIQPVASRTESPLEGRTDSAAHLSHSPQTRSRGSSANAGAIARQSAAVSGARLKSRHAASRNPRRTLSGSSENAGLVWRRTRARRSAAPSNGSITAPVKGSIAIAFTVKSRRAAASASLRAGSGSTANPRGPPPVFDPRRGRLKSYSEPLPSRTLITPKLRPTMSVGPKGESALLNPSKPTPATSMSKSLGACPRSQSRTPPPTSLGRPTRRTASSIARRSSGRGGAPSISGLRRPPSGGECRSGGEDPSRNERGPAPAGAPQREHIERSREERGARDPQPGRPGRTPALRSAGGPEPARESKQGGGMHKLVADSRFPGLARARGLQGPAQCVRAERAHGDAGGPQDPRPDERGAVVHAADRCKFLSGTKAQNEG